MEPADLVVLRPSDLGPLDLTALRTLATFSQPQGLTSLDTFDTSPKHIESLLSEGELESSGDEDSAFLGRRKRQA